MNFKKFFVLCLIFLLFPFTVVFAESVILYISDHDTEDDFNNRYINTLQSFISRNKKNKNIKIERFSGFNINTTESIELISKFNKITIPIALVLMVGESNYYNMYGFSKFMNTRENVKNILDIQNKKTVKEINSEMAKIYAPFRKKEINPSVEAAYRAVLPEINGKIFRPGVFPEFYALDKDFRDSTNSNFVSAAYIYKHSWDLIRNKEYDKAKELLNNIIAKKNANSMFYYALSSTYLAENLPGCEAEALKLLEEGILIDPLNKENICYKGIISMFMMYKGEITSEILFFSRSLNSCFINISDEISAITAINTPNYESKIEIIDDWILFDFDEIQRICYSLKVPFIFASYPDNKDINSLIHNHLKGTSSRSSYVENKINEAGEYIESFSNVENTDTYIYSIAEKMYEFLKGKGIVN